MAEIKKIKIGSTAYEIVPERLQNGSYHLTPPTLTKDAVIATKDDIPDIGISEDTNHAYCTFGLDDAIAVGSLPNHASVYQLPLHYSSLIGTLAIPSDLTYTTATDFTTAGYAIGAIMHDAEDGDYLQMSGIYIDPSVSSLTKKAYLVDNIYNTVTSADALKNKGIAISDVIGFKKTKQDTLVSGTNIKTVNGTSLLGSGDVTISGGPTISYDSTTLSLVFE